MPAQPGGLGSAKESPRARRSKESKTYRVECELRETKLAELITAYMSLDKKARFVDNSIHTFKPKTPLTPHKPGETHPFCLEIVLQALLNLFQGLVCLLHDQDGKCLPSNQIRSSAQEIICGLKLSFTQHRESQRGKRKHESRDMKKCAGGLPGTW